MVAKGFSTMVDFPHPPNQSDILGTDIKRIFVIRIETECKTSKAECISFIIA